MTHGITSLDPEKVAALIVEAANAEVLPRFRSLEHHEVEEKTGPADLVTAADIGAEAYLTPALAAMLPGSLVIGEEAVAKDPSVMARLGHGERVWIIDPVDGTYNFAHGKEQFTMIVALVEAGETVGGWIYAPIENRMTIAEHGSGTFVDGRQMHVSASGPSLKDLSAALYIGPKRAPDLYQRIKDLKDSLGPRSYSRCAGWEYLEFASNRLDYAIFTKQLPWDHAAGCLIATEAGGTVAYLTDRSPYRPVERAEPMLIAPDPATWEMLRHNFCDPVPALRIS